MRFPHELLCQLQLCFFGRSVVAFEQGNIVRMTKSGNGAVEVKDSSKCSMIRKAQISTINVRRDFEVVT